MTADETEPAPEVETVDGDPPSGDTNVYVSGIVVDDLGRWIPEALVESTWNSGSDSVVTDEEGRFQFAFPSDISPISEPETTEAAVPESVTLSATLNALKAFRTHFEIPATGRDDIVLTMVLTASLSGRVIDSAGTPQSGWIVRMRGQNRGEWAGGNVRVIGQDRSAPGATNEAGEFSFTGIAPGEYTVSAQNPMTYALAVHQKGPITLRSGEDAVGITLIWALGLELSGYVTTATGLPIANATVRSFFKLELVDLESYSCPRAQTDSAGHFTLLGFPEVEGLEVSLNVEHKEYVMAYRNTVRLDGEEQDFILLKRPTIEGRVIDAISGGPVTEFRIYNWSGQGVGRGCRDDEYLQNTTSRNLENHPDGEFSFFASGYNFVRVAISAPGYLTSLHSLPRVAPGTTVDGIEIPLEPAAPLKGVIVDDAGMPVEGAQVFLGHSMLAGSGISTGVNKSVTRSQANGEFVITEYQESLSAVSAYHPHYALGWTDVRSLSSPLRITLLGGATIKGVVTFGGYPLENGRSFINIYARNSEVALMTTHTGDGGEYSIGKVPAGAMTMSVGFHEGGPRRYIARDVDLQDGQTSLPDFDFDDAYTSCVEGVLLLDERPVSSSFLRAVVHFDNGDIVYYETAAREDGSYTLGPIPARTFEFGAYLIKLDDGSYLTPSSETISTRPDETTRHDILLASP